MFAKQELSTGNMKSCLKQAENRWHKIKKNSIAGQKKSTMLEDSKLQTRKQKNINPRKTHMFENI